eukprot:scaffold30816_cov66-Skeletonema_marinoi.AAC.1
MMSLVLFQSVSLMMVLSQIVVLIGMMMTTKMMLAVAKSMGEMKCWQLSRREEKMTMFHLVAMMEDLIMMMTTMM